MKQVINSKNKVEARELLNILSRISTEDKIRFRDYLKTLLDKDECKEAIINE